MMIYVTLAKTMGSTTQEEKWTTPKKIT